MVQINFNSKIVEHTTENIYSSISKCNIDETGLTNVDTSKYYVYHHYKTDSNELFYIGKGIRKRAISSENRNQYWHNIVAKHGCKIRIIAENLTQEESLLIEQEEIKKYGRLNNNTGILVNMTDGGDGSKGYIWSEEQREYRRQIMSGENNHQFDVKHFGKDNPNFNNKYGNNPLSKKIVCLDLSSNFIKLYNSLSETELDGFNAGTVSACCLKKRNQHKNHLFIYESEYNPNAKITYTPGKTSKRKVVGIDHINKIYKIYDCANDTKKDGFSPKVVQQCCTKYKKTHYNKEWYYENEINLELLRYSLITNES